VVVDSTKLLICVYPYIMYNVGVWYTDVLVDVLIIGQ